MPSQDFPSAILSQYPLINIAQINFADLFKRVTVLKILGDYENRKTRLDSLQLTESYSFFMEMGVSVVAVSEQFVGAKDFLEYTGWKGKLYIDFYKNVCRAPAPTKPPKDQKPSLLSTLRRSNAQALFRPGGTYIITPDLTVHYSHEPKKSKDSPKIELLIKLCFDILSSPCQGMTTTSAIRRVKSLSVLEKSADIRKSSNSL